MRKWLVLFIWLAPIAVSAQSPQSVEADKIAKLLVGDWSMQSTSTDADGKITKGKEHMVCKRVADLLGVLCTIDISEPKPEQEMCLFGYDKPSRAVHEFCVHGETAHDHVGQWSADGSLVVNRPSCGQPKCAQESQTIKRLSPTRIEYEAVVTSPEGAVSRYHSSGVKR